MYRLYNSIAYNTTVNTLDVSEANLKRMEISKTCVLHAIGLVGGSCEANERDSSFTII